MSDLLDLLANEDRGSLATKPRPTGPFICRWCGREERGEFQLELNHSPDCYRSQRDRECSAMNLTRNHVHAASRAYVTEGEYLPCCADGSRHAWNRKHAISWVRSTITRAGYVWPAERLTWLRTALTAERLPEDLVDELTWRAA